MLPFNMYEEPLYMYCMYRDINKTSINYLQQNLEIEKTNFRLQIDLNFFLNISVYILNF